MASRRPVYRGEYKSGESKGREAEGGGGGTHGMANVVSAHKDKRRKRGRLHKGPGTTWGSKFNLKTKVQRRVRTPWHSAGGTHAGFSACVHELCEGRFARLSWTWHRVLRWQRCGYD